MNTPLLLKTAALAALIFLAGAGLYAQGCTNSSQYPSATTVPGAVNVLTNISTCTYLQEYSAVGPVVVGMAYEFSIAEGGYITVREGTATGPVIAQGYSPVVAVPTAAGTLYAHWNVDANCATSTGCKNTNVMTLSCIPPTVTATVVEDCPNGQFSVSVDVTALGDAASVDVNYTVNGGPVQTLAAQPVGTYSVGPFTAGQLVNVTVADVDDATCNRSFTGLGSTNCPVMIECGEAPLDQTYCYVNNDNTHWHYQSTNDTLPLILIFSTGSIESFTYDKLRIYDGPDNQSPQIYVNPTSTTNLAGVQVVAPSGHIYMEVTSEGSVSCSSSTGWTWNWQVGCLDCNPAEATYTVITDCDLQNFTIDVHVTTLGSDATLDITNDAGAAVVTAQDTGVFTVGPFPITTLATLTLVNDNNSLCNVVSPVLTNPLCPTHITCGEPALQQTYCYTNNDNHEWHWQNTDPLGTLALLFSAGSIDFPGSFGDNLIIYDGPTSASLILYQNAADADLADLFIQSTGADIYMQVTTSGFGSCSDGNETEWAWQVGCYDCAPPVVTYTVNTDCAAQNFTVDVHITDMGSQSNLDITNDAGAASVAVADTGVYTVGPFAITTLTTITLENDTNSLCSIHSPVLTNPLCESVIECGAAPLDQTYCYTNNDSHAWSWGSSTGTDPLIIVFSAGTIESQFSTVWDHIRIYDGTSNTAPLIYENVANDGILTGVQAIAPSGHMYMEMTSEGSGSCSSGGQDSWVWQVGCLDCTPPQATYSVVTDCDSMQFFVDVNISLLGSDAVLDINNNGGALPVPATAEGIYTVGPFDAGDTVVITLQNDENTLCSVSSAALTNPLCPTIVQCGSDPIADTYCYGPNDFHEWHWQSSGGQPLAIQFSAGTLESQFFAYDHIRIYDGVDATTGILLYENISPEFDLTGLLRIASSGDIYMQSTSDGSGNCQGGGTFVPWAWEVGCLDCTNPGATFSVVEDCIHHAYSVAVNVDSTGSSSTVRIANSLSTDTLMNIPAGITMVGPFSMDSVVTLTVMNATNGLCRVFSPEMSSTISCIDSVCAATAYEYCYTNHDTAWFAYQGTEDVPLTIQFLWGRLLPDDYVQIYDGVTTAASMIWQGNLDGDMSGFAVNSTNAAHQLLMRVVSSASGSCATGEAFPPLHWVIQCGAVGVSEVSTSGFSMYPNPTNGELTLQLPSIAQGSADLQIVDMTGRSVYKEVFNNNGGLNTFDLKALQNGNYIVTITTNDWVKSQRLQITH